MSDFLLLGGVTNAINMPSLTAEEAPRLKPYMALAEKLGRLVGQIVGEDVRSVAVEVEGAAAELNQKPITGAVLAGLMGTYSDTVNMVNAPYLAKERGLDVREVRHDREGDYHTLVAVTVGTSRRRAARRRHAVRQPSRRAWSRCSASRSRPSSPATMIYIVNTDAPGFIGALGTTLGEAGINIATFNLGRREAGGEAVALVAVDDPITPELDRGAATSSRRSGGRTADVLIRIRRFRPE